MQIQGRCDDRFSEVASEFERNFAERGELGASVAITVGGEQVVDLWGGHTDAAREHEWERDTLCVVMSTTKGATALCAHLLATSGALDFDEPVVTYWPEFAAAGKESVLVRHVLAHQAGLPALRDPLPAGSFYDWYLMAERLATETPFWEPGTRHGYHALTWGFLVGELVRRIDGRTIGQFFADEVAAPLELDLWIGLPEAEHHRVAQLLAPPDPQPGEPIASFLVEAFTDPGSLPGLVMINHGGYLAPDEWDGPDALRAEIPSAGGVGNARSVAAMYRAIVHDRRVGRYALAPEDIAQMAAVQSAATMDAVLSSPGRWTLGFLKAGWTPRSVEPPSVIALSEEAFGHTGNGGSIGFADPGCDLSFAYVMNQMDAAMGLGPTCQALVDATYRALGYQRDKYHLWTR